MTLAHVKATFAERKAAGKTALVAFVTVGYPSVEESYEAALAALESGADVLELGVPFSDPTADGPVISRASYEAIGRGGSLRAAIEVARRLRLVRKEPIILFSYYNPILSFGEDRLPSALAEAGVDGILVVDLPPEEGKALRAGISQAGLGFVPLLAPTSGAEREKRILSGASGFVYYVSVTGVTGSGVAPLEEAGRHAAELEKQSGLPVVVGFGIDSPDKARLARAGGAAGVVVGTAIIRALGEAAPGERSAAVRRLVASLRAGLDA